ncbi:cell division protein FtsQ/DivIB [Salinicoccus halitifaciens]|uniref:Cell division protein FtsQ n=1 Tax=Salinicoccus halitifaciens TaxID=1073415 RepID=A0ABV2E880_9STAP|nr:FtsQ-type POTRA domain-containing protein [Salinicoccus halitifaciens]MCD2136579.1 FtsQ-type POTRA domain-containing protein [Salinicoccus halitifaciens]
MRKKLESSRESGRQSSIESRLYGSPDDDLKKEKAEPERPKVQDFSTLKKEDENKEEKKEGPRLLADYTKESGEVILPAGPADEPEAKAEDAEEVKPEVQDLPLSEAAPENEDERKDGPRLLADYTKDPGGEAPDEEPEETEAEQHTASEDTGAASEDAARPKKKPKRYTRLTALKENFASIPKLILIPSLLFLILFGTLLWYVFTDASDLKEINISGNEIISTEEIESRLDFETGDKMFSISTDMAEDNIALLPIIVDVTVERDWWNSVDVSIDEYRAVGYVENEGGYNPLLENARILRGYQVTPSSGPLVHHFEGEEMDQLVDNLNDIEPEILAGISEIYYRPSENSMTRIHIFMNDGQELVADYRDFGEKMNHYIGMKEEIGGESEGIIDIEIGSSFLPYDSAEARQIKEGIYNSPETSGYVNEVNASMNSIKEALNEFENFEDE